MFQWITKKTKGDKTKTTRLKLRVPPATEKAGGGKKGQKRKTNKGRQLQTGRNGKPELTATTESQTEGARRPAQWDATGENAEQRGKRGGTTKRLVQWGKADVKKRRQASGARLEALSTRRSRERKEKWNVSDQKAGRKEKDTRSGKERNNFERKNLVCHVTGKKGEKKGARRKTRRSQVKVCGDR